MVHTIPFLLLTFLCIPMSDPITSDDTPREGAWIAWLESAGGALPFGLELQKAEGGWNAWFVNGEDRVAVPAVDVDGGQLTFDMPHYDARISASIEDDGHRLSGGFERRRGLDTWCRLDFRAAHEARADTVGWLAGERAVPPDEDARAAAAETLTGRWAVDFESEDHPAVGEFLATPDGELSGTFLTATGDYRYLAGRIANDGRSLRLSTLDGSHAFLFRARLEPDGTLQGEFWSGDHWHERWTAVRDDDARVPDPFELTRWTGAVALSELRFPDLEGRERSLGDPAFAGKARILQLFASWCPNCSDASAFMVELHERFGDRGLSVVGLAFEVTGDPERDTELVKRYRDRHGVTYPLLVAGRSKKSEASEAMPVLDEVRAFPTTVFLDGDGEVRAIYTGFFGPATGPAYDRLRQQYLDIVTELLDDAD